MIDEQATIADELLQEVWNKRQDLSLAYFSAVSGRKSAGKLMIVGRATNGWTSTFFPNDVADKEKRKQIVSSARSAVATDRCPMSWVHDDWNTGNSYNTARSSFWQAAKQLVERMYGVSDPDWASYLTWTNLYKVSPSDGGNPIGTLEHIQVPICARLLASEVCQYRPREIVFFTGADWALPFLKVLGVPEFSDKDGLISYGQFSVQSGKGIPAVIAPHPQGKRRHDLVESIVNAFQRLGDS